MSGKKIKIKAISGPAGGGIPEAPIDNTPYSREDASWVSAPSTTEVNQISSDLTTHVNDTQVHLSPDERAAIDNTAFTPNAANPFATQGNMNLKEDDLGDPATDGQVLSSTTAGVRSWVDQPSGLPEAPEDGKQYARQDATWTEVQTGEAWQAVGLYSYQELTNYDNTAPGSIAFYTSQATTNLISEFELTVVDIAPTNQGSKLAQLQGRMIRLTDVFGGQTLEIPANIVAEDPSVIGPARYAVTDNGSNTYSWSSGTAPTISSLISVEAYGLPFNTGIPEAPEDGLPYSREDATWVEAAPKSAVDNNTAGIITVQNNLTSHEADLANPHQVTAAQAGADPAGSASTVQGNLNTHAADTDLHINATERAAFDANVTNPPSGTNPIATIDDISAAGGGDMMKSTYDPTNVNGNAFAMDNMAQGTNRLWVNPSQVTLWNSALQDLSGENTDDLAEGSLNLYYTEARVSANTDVAANTAKVSFPEAPQDGQPYSRQDATWVLTPSGGLVDSVNGQTGVVVLDTDDVSEGTANLYFTETRVANTPEVLANTAKTGITPTQSADIIANNGKVSFPEAPNDGNQYARKNLGWEIVATSAAPVDSVNGQIGVVVLDTDDIAEGATNLYYSDALVSANVDVAANTLKVSFPEAPNDGSPYVRQSLGWVLAPSGAVDSVNTQTGVVVLDTDDISEGSTNLYYSDTLVSANPDVVANTAKVGITPTQAADISSAIQPLDNVSELTNDAGYITSASVITDHTNLTSIGVNTHAQIDTHIADTANPHGVTAAQAGADPAGSAATVQGNLDTHAADTDLHITATERAAFDANIANPPTGTNPIATIADISAAGGGDMTKAIYDPTNVAANAFSMGNMVPAPNANILTDAQSSLIASALQDLSGQDTDDLTEGATNLYYTEARVTANTSVAANTLKVSFPEAPVDGNIYSRKDAAWVLSPTSAVDSVNGETGIVVLDTDNIAEGTTNLYYTETRVSNNADVAANTLKVGITPAQASDIVTNNAKVTNATHTGDVAGSTVLTIQPGVVDIPMLSASGTADSTTFLRGDNTWAVVSSGITDAPSDGSLYGRKDGAWELAATAAQGTLADNALQSGDNISELNNDAGFITIASVITDHTNLSNIGVNTHSQIDSHIASNLNPHNVTQAQVGLGNVDNTSDINKPVSTATQLALNGKENAGAAAAVQSNLDNHENDLANPHQVTQAQVGLGNVDNTSDANKPISTATQTALDDKADLVGGVVPTSQLPAIAITEYLGAVGSEAAMLALTGQSGDWCTRTDVAMTYIITGPDPSIITDWTSVSYPAAPVDSVNGQTGVVTLAKGDIGLGNVDNTSDLNKPISTATQSALDLKEDSLGNPISNGQVLASTTGGTRSWITVSGGGISDAPSDGTPYSRQDASWVPAPTLISVTNHIADLTNPHSVTAAQVGLGNVDNTSDLNKPISTATQAALDLKANIASPTFTGTVSGITKTMVGLSNVDNTSDANKPVSTPQQTALDLKANIASPTFTGTVSGITKAMVGLSNVDNTSDLNKPISTATQTALDLKANLASPTFTGTVSGITKAMVGLGNVDNTSDADKPISTATQTALDLKVGQDTTGTTGVVNNIWLGTAAEYAALGSYDPNVLYFQTA